LGWVCLGSSLASSSPNLPFLRGDRGCGGEATRGRAGCDVVSEGRRLRRWILIVDDLVVVCGRLRQRSRAEQRAVVVDWWHGKHMAGWAGRVEKVGDDGLLGPALCQLLTT
jgi:hypothetical protein